MSDKDDSSSIGREGPVAPSELRYLDRNYSASALLRALGYKARRRLFGTPSTIQIGSRVGYTIYDSDDLDGGGAGFGQDYVRVLAGMGIRDCPRMFEFCSGPGYIGFSLLAHGICRNLVLADVNPRAVEAARKTTAANRLSDRVAVYLSDGLDQVPHTEKWDLVVGNPPHFPAWTAHGRLRCEDSDWRLHRRFYSQIGQFLNPGALIVMQENDLGSRVDDFEPMIDSGGGKVLETLPGPDLGPDGGRMYYLVSRWN